MTVTVTKGIAYTQVYNQAVYTDESGSYIYEIVEKESWNGTIYKVVKNYIVVAEVGEIYSTLMGTVQVDYAVNTSKSLAENSFVEITSGSETVSDTYIVVLSDEVLIIEEENAKSIFYENEVKAKLFTSLEQDVERVISLNDWESFINQIPKLIISGVLIILSLTFCIIFCFKTIKQKKNSIKYIISSGAFLVALFFVLNFTDLPSSILPSENIFDIKHYIDLYCTLNSLL